MFTGCGSLPPKLGSKVKLASQTGQSLIRNYSPNSGNQNGRGSKRRTRKILFKIREKSLDVWSKKRKGAKKNDLNGANGLSGGVNRLKEN